MQNIVFNLLIFPGFLFTAICGLVVSWIDRKVTARVQWRQGPPFLQPFYDFVKLLGKETVVPREGSQVTFLLAPLFGLAAVSLVATIVWRSLIWGQVAGFDGDLIVVLYLLAIPSVAVIMGASASRNPLASLGASREMKLLLAYELPFIIVILVPVILSGGKLRLGELIHYQQLHGSFMLTLPGALAFWLVAIICMQAKLTLIPFDIPEAETEIMGGAFIEYSGTPLAIYHLTRHMMLFTVPWFLIAIFWGGIGLTVGTVVLAVLKYVLLLVIIVVIRNTSPRLRIDQAMRFFWTKGLGLATIAALLALF